MKRDYKYAIGKRFSPRIFELIFPDSLVFLQQSKEVFGLKVLICVFKGWKFKEKSLLRIGFLVYILNVGPKAHHSSFDDDQLMKL